MLPAGMWRCGAQVAGGRKMGLRVADPDYLDHVDRWWGELLPRMAPYLHSRGGPIILTQARPAPSATCDERIKPLCQIRVLESYLGGCGLVIAA